MFFHKMLRFQKFEALVFIFHIIIKICIFVINFFAKMGELFFLLFSPKCFFFLLKLYKSIIVSQMHITWQNMEYKFS